MVPANKAELIIILPWMSYQHVWSWIEHAQHPLCSLCSLSRYAAEELSIAHKGSKEQGDRSTKR